jgi:hypothetical protein
MVQPDRVATKKNSNEIVFNSSFFLIAISKTSLKKQSFADL